MTTAYNFFILLEVNSEENGSKNRNHVHNSKSLMEDHLAYSENGKKKVSLTSDSSMYETQNLVNFLLSAKTNFFPRLKMLKTSMVFICINFDF